jgi:hypothetical protein
MSRDGARAALLQVLNTQFDCGLVDAHNFVMRVHLNVQGLAYGNDQMFFVELRVALYGFVLDVFGYVAQFSQGFVSEFVMCVCHYQPFFEPCSGLKKRPVHDYDVVSE